MGDNSNEIRIKKKYVDLILVIILFCVNWMYNALFFHNPRVLYSDELNGYSVFVKEQTSVMQKIFSTEVIRPIPRAIQFVLFQIGNFFHNYSLTNYVLFLGNFLISFVAFYITVHIVEDISFFRKRLLGLGVGILYIVSRFMHCQIFSSLGIMEGLSHMLTLLIFYEMVKLVKNKTGKVWKIIFFWVLAFLCHERYFGMIFAILFAMLTLKENRKKKIKYCGCVLGIGIIYLVFRGIWLGDNMLRGTGATNVKDTFSIYSFIKSIFIQIAYILGINAGPSNRNGISYREVPYGVNVIIICSIICIAIILSSYFITIFKNRAIKEAKVVWVAVTMTVCCIAFSSVTTSIALRFVYVSYSIWLITIAYIISYLDYKGTGKNVLKYNILIIIYFITSVTLDTYYRSKIDNVGFMIEKSICESLYDITVKKYGERIENASILIWDIRGITSDWYYLQLEPYIKTENMVITVVTSYEEIQQNANSYDIVLYQNYEDRKYEDLTLLFY